MGTGKSKVSDENTRVLGDLVRRKDVRLLKASAVARLLVEGKLKDLNRQGLETKHSEAFASNSLVERCLREAEVALSRKQCTYPGVVVFSHAWQTAAHPDPSGSLGKKLALYLHWYAVQRSKWTKERLYNKKDGTRRSDRINDLEFDCDFVVLIDFWCLHQAPRTEKQEAGFARAREAMHIWFGHRGVTVMLISVVPPDWNSSSEFKERGGAGRRGWPAFERRISSLGKGGGVTLDMGGFEEMLANSKCVQINADGQSRVGEDYRTKATQISGMFEGMKDYQLQHLAMWDRSGHASRERVLDGAFALGESCLVHLVQGRQLPPLAPAEMDEELRSKAFGQEADRPSLSAMYKEMAGRVLGAEEVLDFDGVTHWKERELQSVGRAMALCSSLRLLKLNNCELRDAELAAFAYALEPSAAPQLEELELLGNQVGESGLAALGQAMRRGALPRLRRVIGMSYTGMDDGWEQRVGSAVGHPVTYDQGMLTIQSPMAQSAARPTVMHGTDARVAESSGCCW